MARLPDPAVRRRWEARIRSFEQSGLSVVEFCERNDVSTASFYLWRRKLRDSRTNVRPDRPAKTGTVGFVPVTVNGAAARECFRICFANDVVVEVPVAETDTLLRVLEQLADTAGDRETQR